jgi:AcrR family transcriptional regulator
MAHSPDKTKLQIAEAAVTLMEKKPSIDNIKVSEIIDLADVSRPTFYKYFLDKYDLAAWYLDKVIEEAFWSVNDSVNTRAAIYSWFEFIKSNEVFFKASFNSATQNSIHEYYYQKMIKDYTELIEDETSASLEQIMEAVLKSYIHGCAETISEWIKTGMKESSEFMTDVMLMSLPPMLEPYLKEQKRFNNKEKSK